MVLDRECLYLKRQKLLKTCVEQYKRYIKNRNINSMGNKSCQMKNLKELERLKNEHNKKDKTN